MSGVLLGILPHLLLFEGLVSEQSTGLKNRCRGRGSILALVNRRKTRLVSPSGRDRASDRRRVDPDARTEILAESQKRRARTSGVHRSSSVHHGRDRPDPLQIPGHQRHHIQQGIPNRPGGGSQERDATPLTEQPVEFDAEGDPVLIPHVWKRSLTRTVTPSEDSD